MSIEKVRGYLKNFNLDGKIQEFPVSSATVALAAQALGCEEARIAKTLSFEMGESCILIVCAGDCKIDNAKFKAEFHTKAKMLPFDVVASLTGHAVGGVCPFAVNEGVNVYLDESLKRFATVFPAAGSANSAIEMTIDELCECSAFTKWVDVCKLIG